MLQLNQFFIKEHVGVFKLANTYDIVDPATGKKVGLAREKPGGWVIFLRLLISAQLLPTKVEILESSSDQEEEKIVVTIKRGFTLLRAKVHVLIDGDRQIGYFKSKLFSIGGGFWMYDTNDVKIAEVKGDWKGWNFKFLDLTGKEIGTVTKKWAGLGKEMFTSADNYMIALTDPTKQDPGAKALLLAAGIAIDTIFKEKGG